MFNHARTLLLNISGGAKSPGFDVPGEELIPGDFVPLRLPSAVLQVRRVLFGSEPDRAMFNYRAKQLMTLLHATELEEYVLALDPRITYERSGEPVLYDSGVFSPKVVRFSGDATDELTVLGSGLVPDPVGKLRYDYGVVVLSPGEVEIRRFTPVPFGLQRGFELHAGLSAPVELAGIGYQFVVNTDNVGAAWHIGGCHRPRWSAGQMAAMLDGLGEPTMLEIFGIADRQPWKTFRNLWFDHGELPYRLGGLLLAVVYRTEGIRSGSGIA